MYDDRMRRLAAEALAGGEILSAISRRLGVSRSTLRDWRDDPDPRVRPTDCARCSNVQLPSAHYAHLLGLYLGDGCLSALKKDVYSLRIACDDKYPRLIDEAAGAISAIHPHRPVHRMQAVGHTSVVSYWKHWPCLFPQHGPGPKHRRRILLTDWQMPLVAKHRASSFAGCSIGRHPVADATAQHSVSRQARGSRSTRPARRPEVVNGTLYERPPTGIAGQRSPHI